MQFAPRHVVAMVASVCAAVVLAPVGVMAATGQLVNIVDPGNASRKARVGNKGTLHVESRSGSISGAFNRSFIATSLGIYRLAEATGKTRIAITEVTLSGSDVDYDAEIYLAAWTQTTGTGTCGVGVGWTKTELRRFKFPMYETTQILFSGPPLVVPAPPEGKRQCVALVLHSRGVDSRIFIGATGYTFDA